MTATACAAERLVKDGWARYNFYQSPNKKLIYAPMLKCASTYFDTAFVKNVWSRIEFDAIDWTSTTVFGFMMEPRRRHVKGLVEDLDQFMRLYNIDLTIGLDLFQKRYPCIGVHTLGYHQVYGRHTKQINWLPLDTTTVVQNNFDNFVNSFGMTYNWNVQANRNSSKSDKLALFDRLWLDFPGEKQSFYEIEYLDDVLLWEKVQKITNGKL